ncbi:MAG: DUF1553 domain-containing protein [Planctomycetaceae bacterium]
MRTPKAAIWLLAVSVTVPLSATEPTVEYATQIKPLFEHHCVACHGALRTQGGLRLDASQFLVEGGDSGFTIVPNEPESSTLIAALKGEDGVPRMPQDGPPLPDAKIALIERWIAEGANAPSEEPVEGDPAAHWSFRPVQRPMVPAVAGDVRNPIDAFVLQKRKGIAQARSASEGPTTLDAVGEAPKHVLLRRVYLDLIGLPPTPEELRAFLADESPDAYEKVVDRLLADPRHGERWGRHWMDVWRYSDWYGYKAELRNSQKHIWRWRDWIVESLNEGKPYDRMVALMLAADEIAPTDSDSLRATGFLARNYYKFNRDVWLDRTVEHTGKAFLGLTFNCAKCHDHMFDPITQRDYYAMRAFFEPHQVRVDPIDGVLDENTDGLPRVYDDAANTPTYLYTRGNDKMPDKENPLAATLPGFFVAESPAPKPVSLPPTAFYPGMRPGVRATLLKQAQAALEASQKSVDTLLAQVSTTTTDSEKEAATPLTIAEAKLTAARLHLEALTARIAADDTKYGPQADDAESLAVTAATAERTASLAAATADALAAELAFKEAESKPEAERAKAVETAKKSLDAARKVVETATAESKKSDGKYSALTPVYPATSTGRRTMLANWITHPANPLTARVAVNHVWMRHFGEPLVESVFDFGMNGTSPTHAELLDWLADEFVDSGWNLKRLHRLMVTSATYRLDSFAPAGHPSLAADPDNRLLWRMNARRAEGEVIRDSQLALSGQLNATVGGPELPETADQTTTRRSLYYRHAPEKHALFLKTFDGANPVECYRRAETVVPQQALAEMNSRLSREQSRLVAARLSAQDTESLETLIGLAFEKVLCRPPTSEERAACVAFVAEQEQRLSAPATLLKIEAGPDVSVPAPTAPRERAVADLIHVLMNHHDFVTIR